MLRLQWSRYSLILFVLQSISLSRDRLKKYDNIYNIQSKNVSFLNYSTIFDILQIKSSIKSLIKISSNNVKTYYAILFDNLIINFNVHMLLINLQLILITLWMDTFLSCQLGCLIEVPVYSCFLQHEVAPFFCYGKQSFCFLVSRFPPFVEVVTSPLTAYPFFPFPFSYNLC